MKIKNVEAMVLDTKGNYSTPSEIDEAHGVPFICLLKISTDEGITGWSDIETQAHVGKAIVDLPSGGQIGFESIRNALVGEDPLERERLWQKMYRYLAYFGRQGAGMQMISGVDVALWDIFGKAFKQPVCKLLGAKYCDKVKAYASTVFRPTPDDMKRATADYINNGYKAIKFGWGAYGHDLSLDINLMIAARKEAGDHIDLMVDAGWYGVGYDNPFKKRSKKEWIILIKKLEELNILWLEDFIHPENYQGYADIAEHTSTLRLAAGEQLSGMYEFERLIDEGKIDIVQPDLTRCGGFTVARKIADLAMQRQIECIPHAWMTDIIKAASLHLNAYLINSIYLEFNVSSAPMLNHLCKQQIELNDGYAKVPEGYGLGVEIDEKVVKEHRVL